MSAPPRLLLLGGGAVVREYYLPALRALGWLPAALVADPSGPALAAIRREQPGAALWQVDYAAALAGLAALPGFDAAVVALPNWLHEEAVLACLDRGLHVLCEKPLALSEAACRRMGAAAERAGRVLAVGMVRRLLPSFSAAREALAQGLIGELRAIDIEDGGPFAWGSESGAFFRPESGGVLADMGVHYLDLAAELAGPLTPLRVWHDGRGGVEANCAVELSAPGGVAVRIALSRTRPLRNTAIIRGALGELVVEKDGFERCRWRRGDGALGGELAPGAPPAPGPWPTAFHACFARQLTEFAAAIAGERPPPVSAAEAAASAAIIEWAYRPGPPRPAPGGPGLPAGASVVTGGTGFIGAHLVGRLAELGHAPIRVPVRGYRTCAEAARFPVELPRADLLDYDAARATVEGARYVFHLAYGREGDDAARVTVEGTRNVVEAAIAAGCACVVVLSTVFVFGQPPGAAVDEGWPYRPAGGEYGRSKAEMERWCLERAASSGATRVAVLNPACVYGPRGRTYTATPVELARAGRFAWVEGGRGRANYLHVDNLVDAMLLAAASPAAHGRRLIISDGATSWRLLLGPMLGGLAERLPSYGAEELRGLARRQPRPSLLDVARVAAANQRVIDTLARTAAFELASAAAPRLIGRARRFRRASQSAVAAAPPAAAPALPPDWLAEIYGPADTLYLATQARELLRWSPRIDLPAGLGQTVAWLRAAGLYVGEDGAA